ncbi:7096_t:CDS:1 [Diversispora eburnea]|uniref:7096_t:CDS:1 n=1 Tax=Diversispora eburnea TaxID=1213867 RepID=A0A9N8W6G4_9GLOM|nr:7096_t:CDS:1 [Diversispora eburnea]
MSFKSLLEYPPLNAQDIIDYMRGRKVYISGKTAFFIQLEFSSKIITVPLTTSLKDICHDLWNSATSNQKRTFDLMANEVNFINERYKRYQRYKKRCRRQNNVNYPNNFSFDLMNGFGFL